MSAEHVERLPQDATRCRILGVDAEGVEHVYDEERHRVVALDSRGIHAQYQLGTDDLPDWMEYIDDKRGWAAEQWVGWRLSRALFSGE